MTRPIITTDHCLERYIERLDSTLTKEQTAEYKALLAKKKTTKLVALEWKVICGLSDIVRKEILAGEETRAYINDSNFMTSLYERYGFDTRYHFRVNDRSVFVGIEDNNSLIFVTCYPSKVSSRFIGPTKYRKKVHEKAENN